MNPKLLLCLLLLALALAAGCGSATPTPNSATPPAPPAPALGTTNPQQLPQTTPGAAVTPPSARATEAVPAIALLLASLDDDRAQEIQDAFLTTARAGNANVLFNQAGGDSNRQKAQVAQALEQGAGVLVVEAVDANAAAAYVDAAHKAGARVIALDRLINSRDVDAYVAHDDFRDGQLQASEAVRWLTANKTKTPWNFVLLEGRAGDGVAADITRGYYDVLKALIDKKQVVIASDQAHSDWSSDQAAKTIQDALTKANGNVQAVLANGPELARGALQALDQQKLLGKVFVAGAGASPANVQALCAGQQQLAVVEDAKPLGEAAARLAVALSHTLSAVDPTLAPASTTVADKQVPTVRLPVYPATLANAQAVLVQAGRFSAERIPELGKCMLPLAAGATVPSAGAQGQLQLTAVEADDVYAYLANLAAQFMAANAGVQIKLSAAAASELDGRLKSGAAQLVWSSGEPVASLAAQNLVQPTEQILDASRFISVTNAMVQAQDKHFGVPVTVEDYLLLYYNTKLLKTPPTDTDALLKLKTLTKSDASQWALVFDQTDPRLPVAWLGGFKGRVLAEDGKTPTLNTPAMADTLTFLKQLRDQKVVVPDSDAGAANALFMQGKAAMSVAPDSALDDYSGALGDSLSVVRLPRVVKTGEYARPYLGGRFLLFARNLSSDQLKLATAFAQFVTSKPIELELLRQFGRLPALREALDDSAVANSALWKPAAEAAQQAAPAPGGPPMSCIWDSLKANLPAVYSGKAAPADAAKAMQDSAEACIAKLQ